jgi:hypothetical protein
MVIIIFDYYLILIFIMITYFQYFEVKILIYFKTHIIILLIVNSQMIMVIFIIYFYLNKFPKVNLISLWFMVNLLIYYLIIVTLLNFVTDLWIKVML